MRRFHHDQPLMIGLNRLDRPQARHARDVLRLGGGVDVQVFDSIGQLATGQIVLDDDGGVSVQIDEIRQAPRSQVELTIAAAIPKGDRADWMVEKLSEVGVDRFVPVLCDRSVVKASGVSKLQRWHRIATESAKQCRRNGVMQVDQPLPLDEFCKACTGLVAVGMTGESAVPLATILRPDVTELTLLIGPEGGWSGEEVGAFADRGWAWMRLTATILRIETAAVVAAGVVRSLGPVEIEDA